MSLIFPHLLDRPPNGDQLLGGQPPMRLRHFFFRNANLLNGKFRIVKFLGTGHNRRIPTLRHGRQNLLNIMQGMRVFPPNGILNRVERQRAQNPFHAFAAFFGCKIENRDHVEDFSRMAGFCTDRGRSPSSRDYFVTQQAAKCPASPCFSSSGGTSIAHFLSTRNFSPPLSISVTSP